MTGSTFSGNGGVQAGGIAANGGSLSVTNSTFSGNLAGWNTSSGSGGAIFSTGLASGLGDQQHPDGQLRGRARPGRRTPTAASTST